MRLTDERTAELFAGVLDLLIEHGYDKLTFDAIAATTHTSKATLYRNWGSKSRLVIDALLNYAMKEGDVEPADCGSLSADLHGLVDQIPLPSNELVNLMVAVMDAIRRDYNLHETFQEVFVDHVGQYMDLVVSRAVERGEVCSNSPGLAFAHELILAPRVYATILNQAIPDRDYFHRYIDAVVVPALTTTRPHPKEN